MPEDSPVVDQKRHPVRRACCASTRLTSERMVCQRRHLLARYCGLLATGLRDAPGARKFRLHGLLTKKDAIVAVSLRQTVAVGAYVLKQRLAGRKRYPLVLMLEPLFRCNLACVGCGKIDYPNAILNKRLSVQECLHAVDECGAPVVSIAGGEPLLHKELPQIVKGIIGRRKF